MFDEYEGYASTPRRTVNWTRVTLGALVGAAALALSTGTMAGEPTARPCEAPGQDCVDYMRQGGTFCPWAAGVASIGAHARARGWPREVPPLRFPRGLTEQEQAEIGRWFAFGFDSGLDAYQARDRAYAACLRGAV